MRGATAVTGGPDPAVTEGTALHGGDGGPFSCPYARAGPQGVYLSSGVLLIIGLRGLTEGAGKPSCSAPSWAAA